MLAMEFLGLAVFGLGCAALALVTPWFRRHDGNAFVERWMLGELAAVCITALLIAGTALTVDEVLTAWVSGDRVHIAIALGTVVVGVPALVLLCRWLNRVQTRRQRSVPVAVPAE